MEGLFNMLIGSLEDPAARTKFFKQFSGEIPAMTTQHPALLERLSTFKWCPSTINIFTPAYNSFLLYLSAMQNPEPHDPNNECNRLICQRLQIDESRYRTLCVTGCSGCEKYYGPDMQAVTRILEQGRVPVISIRYLGETARVEVQPSCSRGYGDYVAISHVWANGLGNSLSNALPICQLRRITSACQSVLEQNALEDIFIPDALKQSEAAAQPNRASLGPSSTIITPAFWL